MPILGHDPPLSCQIGRGSEAGGAEYSASGRHAAGAARMTASAKQIAARLAAVRGEMAKLGLDALVVPRADEYLGEYLPARNERLRWLSGFTGSAGVAVVLRERAAIFVDGRYTVQVRQQVAPELFDILHLIDTPHIPWLAEQLRGESREKGRVGYDPRTHPLKWRNKAQETLQAHSIELVELEENLIDQCWADRPNPPPQPAMLLPRQYTGRSSASKRRALGAALAEQDADAALIFAADSIAWLLNIRGRDIPCMPLVLGCALLHRDGSMQFFTDPRKLPAGFEEHAGEGVAALPEAELPKAFKALAGQRVLADPATANAWCQLALERAGAELVAADDPAQLPKACKNKVEIAGMRAAHIRDGVAEVKFLCWLDGEVAAKRMRTEAELSDQLLAFRAEGELFQEPSFDTISAAGANAAMCHYNHRDNPREGGAQLETDSVYLVDSGAQYLDGTTDITRTVAIGEPGAEISNRFTLVLKGHIALARAVFPEGTTGLQLDALARQHLWREGLDYDHGTGHGVGAFLSVHEGPQRIAKTGASAPLRPGMVLSVEPGYYLDNRYGIRCENLVVVREEKSHDAGTDADLDGAAASIDGIAVGTDNAAAPDDGTPKMLVFETIALAPFDSRLIAPSLLTPAELAWLNAYHREVRHKLSPRLPPKEQAWLKQATQPIGDAA